MILFVQGDKEKSESLKVFFKIPYISGKNENISVNLVVVFPYTKAYQWHSFVEFGFEYLIY